MKVVALNTYVEKGVQDKEHGKILEEGTVFEVSEERLDVLMGNNPYKVAFVKVYEEQELKDEKPKKRGRKKKE